jgi:hypothetical protein
MNWAEANRRLKLVARIWGIAFIVLGIIVIALAKIHQGRLGKEQNKIRAQRESSERK